MIILSVIAFKLWKGWTTKFNRLLMAGTLILAIGLPFIVNPIDYSYSSNNLDEKVNYKLDLDLLYHPEDSLKVEQYTKSYINLKQSHDML